MAFSLTTKAPGACQAKNLDELLGFSTPMDHKKYDRYGAHVYVFTKLLSLTMQLV